MVDRHRQGFAQFCGPILWGLVLSGINQVETDPIKGVSGYFKCRTRLCNAVKSPKSSQIGVIQRLNAHRDAIYARILVSTKSACLYRCWIGFQRDFHIVHGGPRGACGVDHLGH